jgi:hypothetical protein
MAPRYEKSLGSGHGHHNFFIYLLDDDERDWHMLFTFNYCKLTSMQKDEHSQKKKKEDMKEKKPLFV